LDWIDISQSFQQPADPEKLAEFIQNQKTNAEVKKESEKENGHVED